MTENFIIEFNGNHYPARHITLDGIGETTVSVEELNEVIMDDERGDYVSDFAKQLDESICYYVPAEKMEYSDEDLAEYVSMQIDETFVSKEFSPKRAKQVTNNLIAEMIKGDLINDGDVDIDATSMSKELWYEAIKPYFDMCGDAVKNTAMTTQEYYDWLTEEVGLRLIEIDLLELKGVIKIPAFKKAA